MNNLPKSWASSRNLSRLHQAFRDLEDGLSSPIKVLPGATMASDRTKAFSFKTVVLKPPDPPLDVVRQALPQPVSTESRASLIRRRFEALRARSTTANPICYRCGARGHIAVKCRNSRLCLVCNRHGHQSNRCSDGSNAPSPSSISPPTIPVPTPITVSPPTKREVSAPMAGIRNPILLFNSTPESEQLLQNFQKSFILSDVAGWGVDQVERTINRVFTNLTWRVTIFDDQKYLIQAPTVEWKESMTRRGIIRLDGVKFPVVAWEPRYSEGKKLTSLWVKIYGYPHLLWQWHEIDRMLNPLGAILLEMDPGAGQKCNWKFVRVRIGICDRELLPVKHWMMARDATGYVSGFDLLFEIETEKPDSGIPLKKGRTSKPPSQPKPGPTAPPTKPKSSSHAPPKDTATDRMQEDSNNPASDPLEKGKKVIEDDSGCHNTEDSDLLFSESSDDEGEGLRAHFNKVYGGGASKKSDAPTSNPKSDAPTSNPKSAPLPSPQDSEEEPLTQMAVRLTSGSQQATPTLNQVHSPNTPRVQYKAVVRKPSRSVGASPLRGRSLLKTRVPSKRRYSEVNVVPGYTGNVHRERGSSMGRSSGRKHFGPTSPRRGLRSLDPKWPTPPPPSSPIGTSPETPIVLSDSSSDQPIATPAVSQEVSSRRQFLLPRKSLRLQAFVGPTSVLTKAKKRAKERGEGSTTCSGNSLVNSFPYKRLTTSQVLELFRVYNIQIGTYSTSSVGIIQAIQQLDRNKFEQVVKVLLDKTKAVPQNQLVVIDSLDKLNLDLGSGDYTVSS